MNASTHTALRIHKDRLEQIRSIAAAREMSVSDLLARWINAEIAAGTIPAGIPSVSIEVTPDDAVTLTLGDMILNPDSKGALEFSARLREVARESLAGYRDKFPAIFRNGHGVVVEDEAGGKFSTTRGLALEIADHIESEVMRSPK